MKKYYLVFKNEFHRKFEYKFDFFLIRLRSIVMILLLYFLWVNAASGRSFAGYTKTELVTYVFGASIFSALVFGMQSNHMGLEINSGTISSLLVKPINYFWYIFFRQFSDRVISIVFSILEFFILFLVLKFEIFIQTDIKIFTYFVISLILATFLFHVLQFMVSTMAFWSREAFGPKWLFEWIAIFASGQFFPLSILAKTWYSLLVALPFAYVLYFPLLVYLGRLSTSMVIFGIGVQIIWILIIGLITRVLWRRGLRRYTGEGI